MESYNQSSNISNSSGDDSTAERIPLFATYLNMALVLIVVVIVITPAVVVVRIIYKTKELRTKYYFFVANLLVTNIINMLIKSILQYLIMILYLLGYESNSIGNILKKFILPLHTILQFTSILLLITLAIERAAVLALPFSHKSYMTNKTVAGTIAAVWALSAILTAVITIAAPVNIVWPLGVINFSDNIIPFIMSARLTAAAFILVTNAYLFYKAAASKRKARKNKTEGNQEKAARYTKLVQLLRSHLKPTVTVLVVGGIDIIANTVLCIGYVKLSHSEEDINNIYLEQFLIYPLESAVLLSHSLTYGIYMKEIRAGLPNFGICQRLWCTCPRKVNVITPTTTNQLV